MANVLISIIVPCYNQAQYLDECLQSVFDQTYQDWECIIVNDGSPDNTEEVAKKWVEKDTRFKYFYKENGGLSSARNFGLDQVKGEWIQFLDSDDFLHHEKFEICIDNMTNQSLNLLVHQYQDFNNCNFTDGHFDLSIISFSYKSVLLEWDLTFAIPIHCALFKMNLITNIRFNESLKSKEDWVFWLDIFSKEVLFKFINKNLCSYRNHSAGMTKNFTSMSQNQNLAFKIIYKSVPEYLKDEFVEKILNTYVKFTTDSFIIMDAKDKDFSILLNSRSYRLGDFLLKPLKIILKKK